MAIGSLGLARKEAFATFYKTVNFFPASCILADVRNFSHKKPAGEGWFDILGPRVQALQGWLYRRGG
jgi:hypothetical protein